LIVALVIGAVIYIVGLVAIIGGGMDDLPYNTPAIEYYSIAGMALLWPLYAIKHIVISIKYGIKGLFT
jgi:hypothetical protein